jgi:hypothetical protein
MDTCGLCLASSTKREQECIGSPTMKTVMLGSSQMLCEPHEHPMDSSVETREEKKEKEKEKEKNK